MRCMSVRLSVRMSVTFVDHVKTNRHIFEIFSPSGSPTILVFPYQTGWRYSDGNPRNGGVECRYGVGKKLDSGRISGCIGHVCIGAYIIYRVTLIEVFLGYFRISLHQTRRQYSNEGPQQWNAAQLTKKMLSKCGILSPKKLFSLFFAVSASHLQLCQKSINDVTPTSDTPSAALSWT